MEKRSFSRRAVTLIAAFAALNATAFLHNARAQAAFEARAPLHALQDAKPRAKRGKLGPMLTSANGGVILGWDVDQNGNDGLLAEGDKKASILALCTPPAPRAQRARFLPSSRPPTARSMPRATCISTVERTVKQWSQRSPAAFRVRVFRPFQPVIRSGFPARSELQKKARSRSSTRAATPKSTHIIRRAKAASAIPWSSPR